MKTIKQAGEELRSGSSTVRGLVEEALGSIAEWEGALEAWACFGGDHVLAEAERLDRALESGEDLGPLHGIPIGVKDVITTEAFPTLCGSKALSPEPRSTDAEAVRRLRAAGAIVVGKNTTHEMALGTPWASVVGNPYDLTRNASGSSSGTSAATAVGSIFGGIGTDSGGSIRLPAAVCGVVGLKPTYGRVPHDGVLTPPRTLDHLGPIARTAADARALFEVIADGSRSRSSGNQSVVGLVVEMSMAQPDRAVENRVREGVERLAKAGHEVKEVRISGLDLLPNSAVIYAYSEMSQQLTEVLRNSRDRIGKAIRPLLDLGQIISLRQYLIAQRSRHYFRRRVEEAMAGVDVLAMPTMPTGPGPRDPDVDAVQVIGTGESPDLFALIRYTLAWDVLGYPAIAIPCGLDDDGLPVGLQLVARPHQDEMLLDLADEHERMMTWNWPQHPPSLLTQ